MTRTTTRHTIVYQSAGKLGVTRLEAVGSAAMMPGWTAEFKAAGTKIGKVATKGGAAVPFIVLENQTPDTHTYPTTANIDIPYTSGDTVYFCQPGPGDVLNCWLEAGDTVQRGVTYIAAGTAGKVFAVGTGINVGTSNPIGVAWEDVTASGTATRCLVRFI